jgi:hypothetical protein
MKPVSTLLHVLVALGTATAAEAQARVPREQILAAMKATQGFDPTATTNGARFQAEVLFRVARAARAASPGVGLLLLRHDDWFGAYLERTGRTAQAAPAFVRLSYENRQDLVVETRMDRVVKAVEEGPPPQDALGVRISWAGGPDEYSYEDTLSTPRLEVTNRRVIGYRLVDYGDLVVFAGIDGLLGRPTTGALGVLFQIIGKGRVEESRMAVAGDGVAVARAHSAKGFLSVSTTVTVHPDGRTEKDVPPGRPDLAALEQRLKQELELEFHPLP